MDGWKSNDCWRFYDWQKGRCGLCGGGICIGGDINLLVGIQKLTN